MWVITSISDKPCNIWFEALGKKKEFNLAPLKEKSWGWVEGYSFGHNNKVTVGGEGFKSLTFGLETGDLGESDSNGD